MTNEEARAALCARLRCRREEMEAVIATRSEAATELPGASQAEHVHELRASFTASLTTDSPPSSSARHVPAAPRKRGDASAISDTSKCHLDTVLRRYVSGHTLLMEFAIAEAETGGLVGWNQLG